jgi:hypothetical protein
MSSDGAIELVWGDGEQRFRLGIGQFRELQERVNGRRLAIGAPMVGPMSLANALRANDAWPDDVREVLRLGLIGGGMEPPAAHRAMVNYFDGKPVLPHMKPAFLVLFAGLAGPPDEVLAKKKSRRRRPTTRMRPSTSQGSTETAPR